MVIEAMWVFGAEFQAWQAQRARPHHTQGQQFPFLLAPHASTPIFHGSIPLRDREFPAEHSHCPLDPKEQGEEAALGHIPKLPSALQDPDKPAHPKKIPRKVCTGGKNVEVSS